MCVCVCVCVYVWGSPQKNLAYEFVLISQAVISSSVKLVVKLLLNTL